MIDFTEIIGHEDIIRHFKSSIELGKISQGYIINGETGSSRAGELHFGIEKL